MENTSELRAILLETANGLRPYVSTARGAWSSNMNGIIETEFRPFANNNTNDPELHEYSKSVFRRLLRLKRLYDSINITQMDAQFDANFPTMLCESLTTDVPPSADYEQAISALDSRQSVLARKAYIARLLLRKYQQLWEETQERMRGVSRERGERGGEPEYAPDLEDMAQTAASSTNIKRKRRVVDDIASALESQSAELGVDPGQQHESGRKKRRYTRSKPSETTTATSTRTYADAQTSTTEMFTGDGVQRTVEIETQTGDNGKQSPVKVTISTQTQAGDFVSDTATFLTEKSRTNWAPRPNSRYVPTYEYSIKNPTAHQYQTQADLYEIERFGLEYQTAANKPAISVTIIDPVIAQLGRGSQRDLQAISLGYLRDEQLNEPSSTDGMYEQSRAVLAGAGGSSVIYAWGCLHDSDTNLKERAVYFTHSPFLTEDGAKRNASAVLGAANPYYREVARMYGLQRAPFGCPHKRDAPVCDLVLLSEKNLTRTKPLIVVYVPWNLRTLRQYFGLTSSRSNLEQLAQRYAEMQRAFMQRVSLVINDALTLEGVYVPKGTYPFDGTTLLAQYTRTCGYPLDVNPTAEELEASDFGNGFTVAVFGVHTLNNPGLIALLEINLTRTLQDFSG